MASVCHDEKREKKLDLFSTDTSKEWRVNLKDKDAHATSCGRTEIMYGKQSEAQRQVKHPQQQCIFVVI
jgi:hypothetical protein